MDARVTVLLKLPHLAGYGLSPAAPGPGASRTDD